MPPGRSVPATETASPAGIHLDEAPALSLLLGRVTAAVGADVGAATDRAVSCVRWVAELSVGCFFLAAYATRPMAVVKTMMFAAPVGSTW
jgi:hypothetical protein